LTIVGDTTDEDAPCHLANVAMKFVGGSRRKGCYICYALRHRKKIVSFPKDFLPNFFLDPNHRAM
jgi:hypothetical protein